MRNVLLLAMAMAAAAAMGAGPKFEELRERPAGDFPALTPLGGTESRDAWDARRAELRRAWAEILGPWPDDRLPLETKVLETEEQADHTRLRVSYRIDARTRTEAYILLPKGADAKTPRPGMVCFHPTSKATMRTAVGLDGREQVHYALHLVRRGYVCVAPRNYLWEVEGEAWQQAADRVRRDGWRTGMARMVYDAIRATDVLLERPEVDPTRVGAIGHSLGGKEALYHAAFDERIRASISCEGGVGLRMSNWEADHYLGAQIRAPEFRRDNHEVMSLIAPRALLVIGGESADGAASWPFIEACLPVWRLYGVEERLGLLRHDEKHNFPAPGPTRERVWAWLDAQMK